MGKSEALQGGCKLGERKWEYKHSSKADMFLGIKNSTSVGQKTGTETLVLPHYNKD